MSKVAWHLLEGRQARARLVVGAIVQANGPAGLNDSTAAQAVLKRLLSKQKPVGDYAATVAAEVRWLVEQSRLAGGGAELPAQLPAQLDDGFFAGRFDYATEDAYLTPERGAGGH